jgi:hypothetical protein
MIQYSRARVIDRKAAAYWMPAFRGHDDLTRVGFYATSESVGTLASTDRLRPLALAA